MVILSAISLIALVFAALYIALISLTAFIVVATLLGAWAYFFHVSQRSARGALMEAKAAETRFFELLSHVLNGFKEIKLHSARGEDLEKVYLLAASQNAELKKVVAARRFNSGLAVSFTVFYALLGSATKTSMSTAGNFLAHQRLEEIIRKDLYYPVPADAQTGIYTNDKTNQTSFFHRVRSTRIPPSPPNYKEAWWVEVEVWWWSDAPGQSRAGQGKLHTKIGRLHYPPGALK